MSQEFLDRHRKYAEQEAEAAGVLAPVRVAERQREVRRHVRSGRRQRAGRCVVMHSGPLTDTQRAWAAVLSPLGTAAIARKSALDLAGVHGLRDLDPLVVVTQWGR